MRARLLVASILAVLVFGLVGCANSDSLEISNATATKDGVTVTLKKASAQKMSGPDRYEYAFSGTIANNSDEPVMQVVYTFALTDQAGKEYRSFAEVYDGQDTAIPPHSSVDFSHDGIKWGPQSVPASVALGIGSVKTEAELPAVSLPKEGQFLYEALGDEKLANIKQNPPTELAFHVDQGGYGRTATFKKGGGLDEAVALFCNIKIGKESNEWVTDNYNWIWLTWEDGSTSSVSINLRNLEYSAHSTLHTYELQNLDEFWSYAASSLKDDERRGDDA